MVSRIFRSVPVLWSAWVIARLISAYLMLRDPSARGDVHYYFWGIFGDDPTAMTEYPHAGTWPSLFLAWITGDELTAFFIGFVLMVAVCDGLFLALLLRRGTAQAFDAGWMWVLFATAAGQVFFFRLDLFPALMVAAAGYFLFRHPAFSGIFLGLATAMKLWPGVLAAGLVGKFSSGKSWSAILTFFASLVGLCAVTVALGGTERLFSPMQYQDVRGLQIESVAATPFVFQNYFEPGRWDLGYAPSKSFEITGPGVDTAITIAEVSLFAVVAFAFCWAIYRFIRGGWTAHSALAFFVLIVLLMIATNKVFSTQYIVWLGPVLMVSLSRDYPRGQRALIWVLTVAAVVCAALGTTVYPFGYDYIWKEPGTEFGPVLALAVRNGLILVMVLVALAWFIWSTRTPHLQRTPATPRATASTASTPPTGALSAEAGGELEELGQPGGASQAQGLDGRP